MQDYNGHYCAHSHHLAVITDNRPEGQDQDRARDDHGNHNQRPLQPFEWYDPQDLEMVRFYIICKFMTAKHLVSLMLATRIKPIKSLAWKTSHSKCGHATRSLNYKSFEFSETATEPCTFCSQFWESNSSPTVRDTAFILLREATAIQESDQPNKTRHLNDLQPFELL